MEKSERCKASQIERIFDILNHCRIDEDTRRAELIRIAKAILKSLHPDR